MISTERLTLPTPPKFNPALALSHMTLLPLLRTTTQVPARCSMTSKGRCQDGHAPTKIAPKTTRLPTVCGITTSATQVRLQYDMPWVGRATYQPLKQCY